MTWPEISFGLVVSIAIVALSSQTEQVGRHVCVTRCGAHNGNRTYGVSTLLLLETFALTIGLGLRYLGVLLTGALIILPGAMAKRLANNL
jgi:ABC-type Mn2+/Zn2+ transport system permease subunit